MPAPARYSAGMGTGCHKEAGKDADATMGAYIEIKPLSALAQQLERQGFHNEGVYEGDNLLYEFEQGGECVAADDGGALKRFRKLSPRRWAKWYFTDAAGNPILVCVAPWDRQ